MTALKTPLCKCPTLRTDWTAKDYPIKHSLGSRRQFRDGPEKVDLA